MLTSGGFAERAERGEVGLLVARDDPARGEVAGRPLRGLFEAGDAWLDTGDLVRCDRDGDYWLVDQVGDVIHGRLGAVATVPIEDVLTERLEAIDLVAAYGVDLEGVEGQIPVAAVTLRPGSELDPERLRRIVEQQLAPAERPVVVRLCEALPMTAGQRTRKRSLREAGLFGDRGDTLWLAPGERGYVPLKPDDVALLHEAIAAP